MIVVIFFYDNIETFPSDSQTKTRSQSYKSYECTDDCSGHRASYEWARKKGITDSYDCGGNSQSFIEGCKSYASE